MWFPHDFMTPISPNFPKFFYFSKEILFYAKNDQIVLSFLNFHIFLYLTYGKTFPYSLGLSS